MRKLRIGFLVSGNGGTLKGVHLAIQQLKLPFQVVLVLADRACGALDYAHAAGLPGLQLHYTRQAAGELQEALLAAAPDIVVTTIHKIIDADTIRLLPGMFVNLHYSLLPSFKGLIGMQTVEQARQLNVTVIGATCHEVDEEVDNGRCLTQCAVGVNWSHDTPEQVHELVFRSATIILLQALMQRAHSTELRASGIADIMGRQVLFAPALSFALDSFGEEFWRKVKEN